MLHRLLINPQVEKKKNITLVKRLTRQWQIHRNTFLNMKIEIFYTIKEIKRFNTRYDVKIKGIYTNIK